MRGGFFSKTETTFRRSKKAARLPRCAACKLYLTCRSPRMPVTGSGKRGLFVLAEAPGREEDRRNKQLVGDAGARLRHALRTLGVDLERDCYKLNAVNCRPPDNRTPSDLEAQSCWPYVSGALHKAKPRVVLLLGTTPAKVFLNDRGQSDVSIGKWRGRTIPDRELGAFVFATYHPSYIMRTDGSAGAEEVIWMRDLKRAVSLLDAPAPTFDDEESLVQIMSEREAHRHMTKLANSTRKTLLAFDYETTGVQPYADGHRIVTCSLSHQADLAVAFSMTDKLARALRAVLRNKTLGKVASNLKFEDTWTQIVLKARVRNWVHDTMVCAHILDHRRGCAGLKFLAYVRYGIIGYDSDVAPYLRSARKGASSFNRIDDAPRDRLLLYNGLDSLLERRIAVEQRTILRGSRIA